MYHDFNDTSMTREPRQDPFDNSKKCYGYMDYHPKTHGWSSCSVSDMNRYLANNCLEPIDGPNPTSSPSLDQFCLEVRPRPSWQGQAPLMPTQVPIKPGTFPPGPNPPGPSQPGPFPPGPGPFPPGPGSGTGPSQPGPVPPGPVPPRPFPQGPFPPRPFPPGLGSNPGQGPYPGTFAGSRPIGSKSMNPWPVGPGAMLFCVGPVGSQPIWPGQQPLRPGQGPMNTDS